MKRLDEIEARINAATQGPWKANGGYVDSPTEIIVECSDPLPFDEVNAEFISNSRRDIPDMLGFIRNLITLIEEKENSFSRKIATDIEGNPFPAYVSADEIRNLLNRHLGDTK